MRKILLTALVAVMAFAMIPSPATAVEYARQVDVDDEDNAAATWTSDPFVGAAPFFFAGGTLGQPYECGDTGDNCEYSLVSITGLTEQEIADHVAAGGDPKTLTDRVNYDIGITNYLVPVSDLDIIVYASNPEGEKLQELGRVGELDTDPSEEFQGSITVTGVQPTSWVLLEVVYFAGAGTYDGYVNVF